VTLGSFGATILIFEIPGNHGKYKDCVVGFDTKEEYDSERNYTNYFVVTEFMIFGNLPWVELPIE
jgi:hypothetical protein